MSRNRLSRIVMTFVAMVSLGTAAWAAEQKLAVGTASGTFTVDGKETKLAYAGAFVDQKEADKPVILIVSDRQLPISGWKSESDFMLGPTSQKFVGVAFWIGKDGSVYRTDYHDGTPLSTSSSGLFVLKLDAGAGKDLSGSAVSTAAAAKAMEPVKLDVRFHAVR